MSVLRIGDKSKLVVSLQNELMDEGYDVVADGDFGPKTEKAVIDFQMTHGLVADGIVGANTWKLLRSGSQPLWALTQQDIADAAKELDVEVAVINTVCEVESSGSGFISEGKPKILFERHWMYRKLKALGKEVDQIAGVHPNIVLKRTGGYVGGVGEYDRLKKAKKLDVNCAIESTSYGRFQIMGFWWKELGYESPVHYEECMCKNEGEHLKAFVRFVKHDPKLHKALQNKHWGHVARIYNGPNHRGYDLKLKTAYLKYSH